MRIVIFIVILATRLEATLDLSNKHLIVLRAGIDSVWGKYLFSVNNPTTNPQPLRFTLLLPQETNDFQAIEGASADDLQLSDDGSIILVKQDFPPGTTLINIGFKKIVTGQGPTSLTFRVSEALANLVILFDEGLAVKSRSFESSVAPKISHHNYFALQSKTSFSSGETFILQIDGVPRGRNQLQVVAGIFAFLLLGCATWLAVRSRPREV